MVKCFGAALLLSCVATAERVQSGQLTAADIDDNLNFEFFTSFLQRQKFEFKPDLSGRVLVNVTDPQGRPFPLALVELLHAQSELPTGSNGLLPLFPALDGFQAGGLQLRARAPGGTCPQECSPIVAATGTNVVLQVPSTPVLPSQLDVALVVDTTGSMCDELEYLQAEMLDVMSSVVARQERPVDARLGLVLYRDHGDAYVTQATDLGALASDAPALQALRSASCGGGGDYPEAMEEALDAALRLQWRPGLAARVAFVVADAPPHDEHVQKSFETAMAMRKQGIKVYGLAASGVGDTAEYLMRLLAAVSGARHLWLTDDSGIGDAHQEPKVLCYRVTRLDQLLLRILDAELKGERVEAMPSQIVREVGRQESGVCLIDFQPTTTSTTTTTTTVVDKVAAESFAVRVEVMGMAVEMTYAAMGDSEGMSCASHSMLSVLLLLFAAASGF